MTKKADDRDFIINKDGTGYIFSMKAAVVMQDSRNIIDSDVDPIPVTPRNVKKEMKVMPWGEDNDLPQQIMAKTGVSEVLSAGHLFNVQIGYGDGILPVRKVVVDGKITLEPVMDNEEINDFFETNRINKYLLEQLTDMNYFYNVFPEIILNREDPAKRKIVELNHKEAVFSRWGEMNKTTGIIEDHFYSAMWDDSPKTEDIEHTPVLNSHRPVNDLLERLGRKKDRNDKDRTEKDVYRYIVPVCFPTPGKSYYQKPYWYSIIESGWYDFAIAIPEFKAAIMKNQMTIKYVIYLSEDYFTKIYAEEGITSDKEKNERKKKEFTDIKNFLSGNKNAGKGLISFVRFSPDGKELRRLKIEVLENHYKGGEYLEDSEEVSNIMSYALGVHPSLIGSTPGKNKGSFSGTDKRELFIIKQALLKPVRDLILEPLYLIKKINGWPKDIHFVIPNITLTTLDEGKEKEKVVMQPNLD